MASGGGLQVDLDVSRFVNQFSGRIFELDERLVLSAVRLQAKVVRQQSIASQKVRITENNRLSIGSSLRLFHDAIDRSRVAREVALVRSPGSRRREGVVRPNELSHFRTSIDRPIERHLLQLHWPVHLRHKDLNRIVRQSAVNHAIRSFDLPALAVPSRIFV